MSRTADAEIAALNEAVASRRGIGPASADLAQKIWDGCVDDATLLTLLRHADGTFRSEVAWAVADALRPEAALQWLFNEGLRDTHSLVRYWALRAVYEWKGEVSPTVLSHVENIAKTDVKELKQLAEAVLAKLPSGPGQQ